MKCDHSECYMWHKCKIRDCAERCAQYRDHKLEVGRKVVYWEEEPNKGKDMEVEDE